MDDTELRPHRSSDYTPYLPPSVAMDGAPFFYWLSNHRLGLLDPESFLCGMASTPKAK